MAKPKAETVGSYVKNKEVLRCAIELSDDEKQIHWACSCGSDGEWWSRRRIKPSEVVEDWITHARRKHPDYDV